MSFAPSSLQGHAARILSQPESLRNPFHPFRHRVNIRFFSSLGGSVNWSRRFVAFLAVATILAFLIISGAHGQQIDPKTYGGMQWRLIGPFRGGRVITVTGVPSQLNTYYFGAVAGGVWETTEGGN